MRRLTNDLLRIGRWNISTSYVWPGAVVWWPWHERPLDKILKDWEQLDQLWSPLSRYPCFLKTTQKNAKFSQTTVFGLFTRLEFEEVKIKTHQEHEMHNMRNNTKINNHSYLESQNRHGMGTACTCRVYIYMPIKDVILQILANLSAI